MITPLKILAAARDARDWLAWARRPEDWRTRALKAEAEVDALKDEHRRAAQRWNNIFTDVGLELVKAEARIKELEPIADEAKRLRTVMDDWKRDEAPACHVCGVGSARICECCAQERWAP